MDAITPGGECHATARWPPFPVNYVSWFLSKLQGKAVPLVKPRTQVEYRLSSRSEIIEHCPLVMQQGLSQSEAFPPVSLEHSNVITQKPYKKKCECT